MKCSVLGIAVFGFVLASAASLNAQTSPAIVVFQDAGFPTLDTAVVPESTLHRALPNASFSSAVELPENLTTNSVKLLVLPYGSAFPEEAWPAIRSFLLRGGDLLTIGGRPFTRPVRCEGGTWIPLPETYAFARQLLISDYQKTAGSQGAQPVPNQDVPVPGIAKLRWLQAYSMVIRLSQGETSSRVGMSGTFDSELKTLLWGVNSGLHRAAPVVEIDHFQNDYAGGRWIMANCKIDSSFADSSDASAFIAALARQAVAGAELLRVTPTYPLYLPDEAWQFELQWNRFQRPAAPATAIISIQHEGVPEIEKDIRLDIHSYPDDETITLPSDGKPGFHTVSVRLRCGNGDCGTYHTAFWVRDRAYLDSGPRVSVGPNYFRVDGKPIEVVGTTYMASDVQRLYFRFPNPYVWDQDMKQISGAGINMLRTGLWTDWNLATGNTDVATERARRTIEAYLMTARRYRLPVQFTLFSFMPEVFGGTNPYLAPQALPREHHFVASMVKPFSDVPFLMWDLINEPSFDNPHRFFGTHPNHDPAETSAWNNWLLLRYGSRNAIQEAWHTVLPDGPIAPPDDADMTAQSANDDHCPLAVYDFNLFAQQSFANWAQEMRDVVRGTGSQQLITVGQDEGGELTSPSPTFFASSVDFTTVHSWWLYDDLLWDSLAAKQKGLPMLVQETGVMTEMNADARPRRNPDQDATLLERKLGIAMDTGAGAIQWLWNINAIMRSQQEVTIGAVRPDGTEKPEADVLTAYAAFAKQIHSFLEDPEPAQVSILTSQSEQFSVLSPMAIDAQHRAVRALNYECHIAGKMVSENHLSDIAGSKLTILPSPEMLQDSTWKALMDYVSKGGNLLITGPVERDEHWQLRNRLSQIGIDATVSTLLYRDVTIQMGSEKVDATFAIDARRSVEILKFKDGKSYIEATYGSGHIFLVSAPVELAESPEVAVAVYQHVLSQLGISPSFDAANIPASVLVRPLVLKDAVLYLLSSESSDDQELNFRDSVSGGRIKLRLPASRTAVILLNRKTGQVIAAYQPPQWAD